MSASGPAFPCSIASPDGHQDGPNTWQFPGLSKRDLIAAMVMQGFAADSKVIAEADEVARAAVSWADALIDALAGKGSA